MLAGLDLTKLAVTGGLILALLASLWGIYHEVQTAAIDRLRAQEAAKIAAEQHAQDQRSIAGLQEQAALASSLAKQEQGLRNALRIAQAAAAGPQAGRACVSSPAGRAFIGWVQQAGRDAGAAPDAAGGALAVPSAAPVAR